MAFPWIFESSLETTATPFGWDSESDTDTVLDVPHYSELARFPWSECAPYRGASCLRIALAGGTNDATLTEGDIDIADAATRWFRFYLYLAPNFTATADDTLNLFELQQAAGTIECALGLRITAATGAIEIGIGDGIAPTSFATSTLSRNRWYAIELRALISTGGAGTLDLYVDGSASLVALSSLTNAAAVGQGVLGVQNQLATTTGTILMDQFVMDDLQVYPIRRRWPSQVTFTQSGHAFVGSGIVDSLELLSGAATDNIATLYDTDAANVNDAQGFALQLNNTANSEVLPSGDLSNRRFERGCYVQLTGTNPRATLTLLRASGYWSPAAVRRLGRGRRVSEVQ